MLIACLNFYSEIDALKLSVPTYYDHVDKIVAIDGAYEGYPVKDFISRDGSNEYLASLEKVELVIPKTRQSQINKRTSFFKYGSPGDTFFIIDADELVENADRLRSVQNVDVGWVTVKSPIYKKPYKEPRLFAFSKNMRYGGRHHWLFDDDGLVASHHETGAGHRAVAIDVLIDHRRDYGKDAKRKQMKQIYRMHQREIEKTAGMKQVEPLDIVMLTSFDPAGISYGLARAITETTPHTARSYRTTDNYLAYPTDGELSDLKDLTKFDVTHVHLGLGLLKQHKLLPHGRIVSEHHGTIYRRNPMAQDAIDKQHNALRLCATIEMTKYGLTWLPNPIPVDEYRAMANRQNKTFKICHSPTARNNKGTDVLIATVKRLKNEGVAVDLVLVEKKSHTECLKTKATCDATFDSFWLGIQVSGLEAAAMGQPVIAGDDEVAEMYKHKLGYVPYTYADDKTLYDVIKRLVEDKDFYTAESKRVHDYVRQHHDYAVVASMYLGYLKTGATLNTATTLPLKKVITKRGPRFITLARVVDQSTGKLLLAKNSVLTEPEVHRIKMKLNMPTDYKGDEMAVQWYTVRERVIDKRTGTLLYGIGRRIPMTDAIKLGLVKRASKPKPEETKVVEPEETKVADETKIDEPEEAKVEEPKAADFNIAIDGTTTRTGHACKDCDFVGKTKKDLTTHRKRDH